MSDFNEYEPQQYVKLPIPVTAQRMKERFTVKTLEGTLEGKAGDYLMTGVNGEQYPCDAEIFAKTYRHLPPRCERCHGRGSVLIPFSYGQEAQCSACKGTGHGVAGP